MALVVITGGARSGKSTAAQMLAESRAELDAQVVVAVFARDDGSDTEFSDRVARHRADRPAAFLTLEATDATAWFSEVPPDALLVVDCVGTMLGLAMEDAFAACEGGALADADSAVLPAGFESALAERFAPAVEYLLNRAGDTIVVTNEVGSGVVPGFASARLFRDALGSTNRRLISAADAAYLVVAGRAMDLRALPGNITWPVD